MRLLQNNLTSFKESIEVNELSPGSLPPSARALQRFPVQLLADCGMSRVCAGEVNQ